MRLVITVGIFAEGVVGDIKSLLKLLSGNQCYDDNELYVKRRNDKGFSF